MGASRGSASFVDGHETRFEVVGRDALSDLAVLRTDDDAARAAELGDASRLRLVAALAGPSEVVVSQTVRDLVAGSGLTFEDAGEHELKGVPDRWHLYRVVG